MAIELPCMRNRSFLDPIATFQLTLRLNLVLGSAPPPISGLIRPFPPSLLRVFCTEYFIFQGPSGCPHYMESLESTRRVEKLGLFFCSRVMDEWIALAIIISLLHFLFSF